MKKTTAAAALFLAFSSLAMSAAHADVITYYFASSGLYNGTPVNNTNVFATATFSDVSETIGNTTTSYVKLVMAVSSPLQAGAYVNDWAFNSDTQGVTVKFVEGIKAKSYEFGDNVVNNFGGSGKLNDFDLRFSFSNGKGELAVDSTSIYKLSGTDLSASSFAIENPIGIFSAVHVQGYGASSFYKGVTEQPPVINPPTEIPEPGTVALLGLGLLGFAAARHKAGKSRAA